MKYFLRRILPRIRGIRKFYPEFLFCKKSKIKGDRIVLDYIKDHKMKLWYFIDQPTWRSNCYYKSSYEKNESKLFKKIIKKDWVILDIGANIGYHSIIFSKLANKGRIYAFEPAHNNYELLLRNIKVNNCMNIFPQKLALGERTSSADLLIFEDYAYNSFADSGRKKFIRREKINLVTLDNFIHEQEIGRIDFLKIDAEGYENHVLRGGLNSILKFRPKIFCELFQQNLDPFGLRVEEIIDYISQNGYSPYIINKNGLHELKSCNNYGTNFNFFFEPI